MGEESSRTHDVFLSYSSKDKNWADATCAVLERHGIRCWIAPRDITPGDDWGAAIIKGINGSRMMVLIFSGHANASAQVRREVERAISRGMSVLPVRVENVLPKGALEYALGITHWLDAFTPPIERHLESIARSVQTLLAKDGNRPGTQTSPPIPARRIVRRGLSTVMAGVTRLPIGLIWHVRLMAVVALLAAVIVVARPWARPANVPKVPPAVSEESPKQVTNSLGMKFVLVPSGKFLMGSPDSDKGAGDYEKQHHARIARPFYLGVTEVTVGQFRRFVEKTGFRTEAETDDEGGTGFDAAAKKQQQEPKSTWRHPGFDQTDEHPVVNMSWNDAVAFCNRLSVLEGLRPYYQSGTGTPLGGDGYRLPTEAEWEYACRAGTSTRYSFGDHESSLGKYAWFEHNSKGMTHPVAQKRPNKFGLYDMHGNVSEWCWDCYAPDYYHSSPIVDTTSPPLQDSNRVLRGGGWRSVPRFSRSADRGRNAPDRRHSALGFRVARGPSGG